MLQMFQTACGFFVSAETGKGKVTATVHRNVPAANRWRVCFAVCSGQCKDLQGKVEDFLTYRAAKTRLEQLAQQLQ